MINSIHWIIDPVSFFLCLALCYSSCHLTFHDTESSHSDRFWQLSIHWPSSIPSTRIWNCFFFQHHPPWYRHVTNAYRMICWIDRQIVRSPGTWMIPTGKIIFLCDYINHNICLNLFERSLITVFSFSLIKTLLEISFIKINHVTYFLDRKIIDISWIYSSVFLLSDSRTDVNDVYWVTYPYRVFRICIDHFRWTGTTMSSDVPLLSEMFFFF